MHEHSPKVKVLLLHAGRVKFAKKELLMQLCHLPESNERSSHYKCDALPLGQGGFD
jgi:hypothetical protein